MALSFTITPLFVFSTFTAGGLRRPPLMPIVTGTMEANSALLAPVSGAGSQVRLGGSLRLRHQLRRPQLTRCQRITRKRHPRRLRAAGASPWASPPANSSRRTRTGFPARGKAILRSRAPRVTQSFAVPVKQNYGFLRLARAGMRDTLGGRLKNNYRGRLLSSPLTAPVFLGL